MLLGLLTLLSGCRQGSRCDGEVGEVTYRYWTGHVVPPWSEEYTITRDAVRLVRTGEQDSEVNAGTWELDVDPARIDLLFEQLGTVDWRSVVAIEPDEVPVDGGRSTSYRVECEKDTVGSVWYHEGWTYRGAEAVIEPIDAFLEGLNLPAEAERFLPSP
jgi:hypothetical protein